MMQPFIGKPTKGLPGNLAGAAFFAKTGKAAFAMMFKHDCRIVLRTALIKTAQRLSAATVAMLGWSAMAALAHDDNHTGQDHGGHDAAVAPATGQGRSASPKGAQAYFHYPVDGIRVPQRFTAQFGLRGMGIAPAGIVKAMTGHHHLLIDADNIDLNQPIPSDYSHIHLGNGQTEVVLTLSPGTHTLQLLLGDHVHLPHVPPVRSKTITIYVR